MIIRQNRLQRWIAPVLLGLGLFLAPGLSPPVLAQGQGNAPNAAEESSGRSLDGYLGTGALAFLALFLVGKSARR